MAIGLGPSQLARNRDPNFQKQIAFEGSWQRQWQLQRDQILQVTVGIPRPSSLPPNARIEVCWRGPDLPDLAFDGKRGDLDGQASAGWEKTLHALDPDVHLVYKVPTAGLYRLNLETVTDRSQPLGKIWRDSGLAPQATALPVRSPPLRQLPIRVSVTPVSAISKADLLLEAEPTTRPSKPSWCLFRTQTRIR